MKTKIAISSLLFAAVVSQATGFSPLTAGSSLPADSAALTATAVPRQNVVDEVVWVVGDEPILKSDIEVTRLQGAVDGGDWGDNADCLIPEQLAVQKLFLHQAALDSIEVTESEISQGVDQRINYWISLPEVGSRERLEQLQHKSITEMRQEMHDEYKNMMLTQRMQEKLVEDIAVSPAEVRQYFRNVPQDSLPLVPTMVEVQIITMSPRVPQEEINRVKDELREYTDRVTKGETSFSTLARFYSEDPGSARKGGELGLMGRGVLDPAFATVAFNLTDPQKISKIVETEFGFHIIQLIEKRGDKVNVRHILRKPRISQDAIAEASNRLDSLSNDIKAGNFTFETAATYASDDKDTRNNNGLMVNSAESARTSRFAMKDLPTEVAREVENLQVGEISKPFTMVNSRGKTVCAIVKLKSRIDEHRAMITEDFQVMQEIVLAQRKQEFLNNWVAQKIKDTYVRMNPRYSGCTFHYEGWIK